MGGRSRPKSHPRCSITNSKRIIYLIALLGAFLAGCINTLSGNGSAITLTVLMELLGLPAGVANATNRVGVAGNGVAAVLGFRSAGRYDLDGAEKTDLWRIVVWVSVGASVGIWLSLEISNEAFRRVFRYLLVVMLIVILVKPKRWLRSAGGLRKMSPWVMVPLYFVLGVYGGFIQMGMGVFFLAVTVLVARYEIIQANAVKALAVTAYTLVAVGVFAGRGLIDWEFGLLMAVGQMAGGYLTARFSAKDERAGKWAYWLLVVVVIAAIAKAFWPA